MNNYNPNSKATKLLNDWKAEEQGDRSELRATNCSLPVFTREEALGVRIIYELLDAGIDLETSPGARCFKTATETVKKWMIREGLELGKEPKQ